MSKSNFKNYKNNDRYYDDEDEDYSYRPKNKVDKRQARRFDRALKTKDISALVEDEEDYIEEYNLKD